MRTEGKGRHCFAYSKLPTRTNTPGAVTCLTGIYAIIRLVLILQKRRFYLPLA